MPSLTNDRSGRLTGCIRFNRRLLRGKEDERTSGFLMVAARARRRLPSFPGNTQERPLRSEVVEGEAGREVEDDDAAGARGGEEG